MSAGARTAERRSGVLRGHEPGLDGLRAVSIAAVLAYHGGLGWAHGGFLGISVFFALSGFLVATVLLGTDRSGGIRPTAFWARRVRRLFPASTAALLLVAAYAATAATRAQADALPGQALAAAANVANWKFVADGTSYAASFEAPSPVLHYWSLSVEEQFYLLAPLALAAVLGSARLRRHLLALAAGGAALAVGWGAWLQHGGASLERLYYGTDVRAAEILVGVAAAVALDRAGRPWIDRHRGALGAAGAAALVGLAALIATADLTDRFLWRGGFAACAALTVAAVAGALGGSGPLRVLAWGPVAALGRISYGVYLYHFPIFLWLSPTRLSLGVVPLFGVRVAATVAVATASYHLIEMPVRRGWTPPLPRRWVPAAVPAVALAAVAVVALGAAAGSVAPQTVLGPTAGPATEPPATDDAPFDVLVIGDDLGSRTFDALQGALGEQDGVRLVAGPGFACDRAARVAGAVVCGSWLDQWGPAVEAADPDLVLLLVADWSDVEVSASLGADGAAALDEVLGAGLDLLTAGGASVVWAPPGRALQLQPSQFLDAMQRVLAVRPDVRTFTGMPGLGSDEQPYLDAAGPVLADRLLEAAAAEAGGLRVLVVGDSQAASLSVGLERWAETTGSATVWSVAVHGCALLLVGEPQGADGGPADVDETCRARDEAWTAALERFGPDVVVVEAALGDIADRRVPGGDGFVGPGDPAFDEAAAADYRAVVDVLTSTGARVAWLRSPCVRFVQLFPGSTAEFDDDPARIAALNEIVERVQAERADQVELVGLDELLCPGGRFLEEVDGIEPVRPDGLHLSPEAADWLGAQIGPQVVAVAERP